MVLAVVAVVVAVVVGFCNNENSLPEPCSLCISVLVVVPSVFVSSS